MKIAAITCYKDPDYIRARTLRAGLLDCKNIETVIIKNRSRGMLRYVEILSQIIAVKFREHPDAYLLTFRGYELLPFLLLIAGKAPVIFDEFINLTEWVVDEHKKLAPQSFGAGVLNNWYGRQLRRCRLILADTDAHAKYSANRSRVPLDQYRAVPVGTDETIFHPSATNPKVSKKFTVFYYGSMLALHGLDVVMQAAVEFKNRPDISFLMVGGGVKAAKTTEQATKNGAHIIYKSWINFDELPTTIAESSLCLAGPFGNTVQSQLVLTGKAYQFLACAAPTVIGQNEASIAFENKKNALVVKQGDAKALAEAISWAADHPKELAEIAKRGRQTFESLFSRKEITKRIAAITAELG